MGFEAASSFAGFEPWEIAAYPFACLAASSSAGFEVVSSFAGFEPLEIAASSLGSEP